MSGLPDPKSGAWTFLEHFVYKTNVFLMIFVFFDSTASVEIFFCVQNAQNIIKLMVFLLFCFGLKKHRGLPTCGFKTSWSPYVTFSNPFPGPSQSEVV